MHHTFIDDVTAIRVLTNKSRRCENDACSCDLGRGILVTELMEDTWRHTGYSTTSPLDAIDAEIRRLEAEMADNEMEEA